jgi:hypothetical protein
MINTMVDREILKTIGVLHTHQLPVGMSGTYVSAMITAINNCKDALFDKRDYSNNTLNYYIYGTTVPKDLLVLGIELGKLEAAWRLKGLIDSYLTGDDQLQNIPT